ncbi:nucleoside-diphosphate sugar epimerase [Zobellella taiwanensis]|uniref:Nucleoside-diphosphate sugar epimerase n=1 Tax=Zobellella taiwanensis TaxID=347535 RepID=A0A2P7QQ36_9GAMM|nr:SDR family oxidoreductase [Zobellella taiwanensis]PSJ40083.1 nucleoside-diphosphate sugar epimerase [Zobellella taiwanensis]
MNLLLTGATGFLGGRLAEVLQSSQDINLTAAVRRHAEVWAACIVEVQGLDANTDWTAALAEQQVVIHAAARAHIMKDELANPLAEYRKVNVDGTLNLARQAAAAGVKRFIFISSIKVNGEQTPLGKPFTAEDAPAPEDAYGISKLEAEQGLQQLAAETGMEVVIIRPPLVYGPNVKGNFASMIKLVQKGLPLPLGAVHNHRSLVALDNLVDLIITCIDHPSAANQVFLAGDGEDLSTTELLRGVARAMGKPARLIPVPAGLLQLGATMLGKKAMAQRLLGSLQVDISKARNLLGWTPPLTVEQGLKRCFETKKG